MGTQVYDFTIEYCRASENGIANALSRYAPGCYKDANIVQMMAFKYEILPELEERLPNIHIQQSIADKI